MSISFLEVLYTALSSDSELSAVINGIYYDPPGEVDNPYLVFGAEQDFPGRLLNDTERAVYQTIHVYSSGTRKELKQIMALVETSVKGISAYEIYLDETQVLARDEDNWLHGVLEFRAYVR